MPIIFTILLCALAGAAYWQWSKQQNRKRLLTTPLTAGQRAILKAEIPLLARLPAELHGRLEGKINLFLNQVELIGCDGLEVTPEMELSIAGQACLLIVNSDVWYTTLRTVLVYPTAFKSVQTQRNGYVTREKEVIRLGESWAHGPVILSWRHSHEGAMDDTDGHNVVLHEFAHQLDNLSGTTNGVPILNRGQSYADWERVFLDAFDRHIDRVDRNAATVLDAYGAQNHEEFLAVAIEAFFETPKPLQDDEPALYTQLTKLLQIDPASWQAR